jgi:hypothetical protein
MIAKTVREAVRGLMGETLDLLRVSPLGDRQIKQIQTTLKNIFNRDLVSLLEMLEAQKVIRKCNCLTRLLACTDPKERRMLFDERKNCDTCGGVGYIDVIVKKTASKKKKVGE